MAMSLAKNGHMEAAKTIFTILEVTYKDALTTNNLASYYDERYDWKTKSRHKEESRIIRLYKKSMQRQENVKAACSLGTIYFKKKQYRVSSYYYRKALKRKQRPELYYNLGLIYFYEGEYEKAIRLIKKAIRGLKVQYQYEAMIALIYMYSIIGSKEIARLYFYKLVHKYKRRDVDLLQLAYACEEYSYIDQNCLSLLREKFFTVEDVEVVLIVLFGLGKEKLAKYFMQRVLEEYEKNPELSQRDKVQYLFCYQKVRQLQISERRASFRLEVIPHKKFYVKERAK